MSITLIETKDLRPYHLPSEQLGEWVYLYDQGVIELDGMLIKTNLAPRGELSTLASSLVEGCADDGCEAQRLFDYVPYPKDMASFRGLYGDLSLMLYGL